MSPAAFLSLAAVTAVAVVGAAVAVATQRDSATTEAVGGDSMFRVLNERIDDLARLEVETPRYRLDLAKQGDAWVAVGHGDYPAKSDTVADIVASIARMKTVEPKTSNPDWYQYVEVTGPTDQADPSGVRLTALAANGDLLADAIVGAQSSSIGSTRGGGTFVRRVDEAQSWLVAGTVMVPGLLSDWFDQIVHVPGTDLNHVTILVGDETVFDAEKTDPSTGKYQLLSLSDTLGPEGSVTNDDGLRSLGQGVVSVTLDDVRALAQVTFPPDSRTLRFTTTKGLHLEVRLGQADGGTWVAFTATADAGSEAVDQASQIAARTDRWAFKLPDHKVAALNKNLADLVSTPEEQQPAPAPSVPFALPPGFGAPAVPFAPQPAPAAPSVGPLGPPVNP